MTPVNAAHYVLGAQGLGLLRGWLSGEPAALERQLAELRRCAEAGRPPLTIELEVSKLGVRAGRRATTPVRIR